MTHAGLLDVLLTKLKTSLLLTFLYFYCFDDQFFELLIAE